MTPAPRITGPVVLVVDDDPSIRDLFARVLAFGGLFPIVAESAEAALHMIEQGQLPDAILLDLKMPGLGGLGFLLQLRSNPRHAGIPVAIVTGDCVLTPSVEHAAGLLNAEIHFKPLEVEAILDLTIRLIDPAPTA